MILLVTTATQIFLSWGNSPSEKGFLPRVKIFYRKIDFHGISFQENEIKCFLWWQSLSLHLSQWLTGFPRSPCSSLGEYVRPSALWVVFLSEAYWRAEESGWGPQCGMDQQHWSKLQCSVQYVFLNFFSQEKASGFCHSAWLYYKPDVKCWSFPLEDPCFLVISICNVSFARGKQSCIAMDSAGAPPLPSGAMFAQWMLEPLPCHCKENVFSCGCSYQCQLWLPLHASNPVGLAKPAGTWRRIFPLLLIEVMGC